jgi:hypothetical protein
MAKIKPVEEWTRSDRDAARAVLLEVSPFQTDGGELIGRDPRSIAASEFQQAGIDGAAILAVIRAKCLDCVVYQPEEVRKCVSVACPNWPYRMGSNPFRKQDMSDEDRERRRAQGRALAARRHGAVSADVKNTSENPSDDPAATPVADDADAPLFG